jgi:multidrug transporter EmrE-like cation transporter
MSRAGLLLVILSAVSTVAANLMMRTGVTRAGGFGVGSRPLSQQVLELGQQPLFVIGVLLYGFAALVWFRVLSTEDLSSSYPLLISLTFVLVTLGAVVLFREHLNPQKLVGLAVILTGVVLVARS